MELRVLVVCPDQDAADLVSQLLSELGIEPEHTASISGALKRVGEQPFDAVILDYRADRNSQDFIGKLRHSGSNRNTPLIAIIDGEYGARPAFSLGANFVLYRPLSLERTRISLRAARGLMRRERRRAPRIPVTAEADLDFVGAENQRATLLDLSEGGTALRSDRPVPPRCKVYFQFALPGQLEIVRLSGEVAWQDATGRTGIRFLNVPQASRRLIHAWLMLNSFKTRPEAGRRLAPPFSPAAETDSEPRLTANASDRRGEQRFRCKLGAEVYRFGGSVPNRCTLSDVSEGGCYVETPSPFTTQTGVEIVVRTADMKLKIRGQVLAAHPGFGMSVHFLFCDEDERKEILRLLALLSVNPSLDELTR
jgi:CheY-like chemotaxis protein/c-di-GMP-binding flagellar brake protein YcgR